jgi:hypothetical protein
VTRAPRARRLAPARNRRTTSIRVIAFGVVLVAVVGGVGGYLLHARAERDRAARSAPSLATVALAQVANSPRIVFRSESRSDYGVLAMVGLSDPSGARALTSTKCDRLYSANSTLLCIALDRVGLTYSSDILNPQLHTVRSFPLSGVPSRARLSADGTLAATTTFIAGDSYASGSFSTRTAISTVTGPSTSASLEDFTLVHNGATISAIDRNFWGVTFAADDNAFYVTVAFSGHTWLARGDLHARTVTTIREDAECPSLSPDGRHLVYKKRVGLPSGQWRLFSLDLATGVETKLAEPRSVDDQVEWLDNKTVLYAVLGSGGDPYLSDVYSVPADGSGKPTLLIRLASSPAVVRSS